MILSSAYRKAGKQKGADLDVTVRILAPFYLTKDCRQQQAK
jgi:hypothetical protein